MMEATAALSFQSCSLIGGEKRGRKSWEILRFSPGLGEERRIQAVNLRQSKLRTCSVRAKGHESKICCSCKKSWAGELSNLHSSVDEALILKRKSEEVLPELNGQCIYLVGMMGSGKSTIGRILSEALGYSFFDSDKLVEEAVGMSSVTDIFKEHSEAFFRDSESKVLRDLSSMCRLVVATGGGAVIRPINWKYMKQGITVWLDVPLEALAKRIAADGTASRPLLPQEPGDPYTEALARLSALSKERGEDYANADARVCLQNIADKQGHGDVSILTPTAIAVEALVKIDSFLTVDVPASQSTLPRVKG
ncbi:uncharacterized protein A4U43_C07F34980 [Asparagus officinalis]|uniref:shikimate kinase n=1 Tax=Asparagus officinalis TaxID=4686 RepID=A0A5P1EJ56_ASPOF|nr:shikimate kinase 3, chloroplastic-like [Asparagus officinalis]ONK65227.1 uncharacterized protein A4U43_C07F34980 [Asparagus officinalis]